LSATSEAPAMVRSLLRLLSLGWLLWEAKGVAIVRSLAHDRSPAVRLVEAERFVSSLKLDLQSNRTENLMMEDHNGVCTRVDLSPQENKSIFFTCNHFRLGNRLMLYWNARAYAFMEGWAFYSMSQRKDLIQNFPTSVLPTEEKPSELQRRLWSALLKQRDVCWECPFPHGSEYSPWRLIGDVILKETQAVVRNFSKAASLQRWTSWDARQDWAVVHYRCDVTLWQNEQYGFLPHHFIEDRLPHTTSNVLIVGQIRTDEPLCARVLADLDQHLREVRGLQVTHQQNSPEQDWLTLATAPVLFCSPSTYCLTAAMGNPNTVYFPMNGWSMAVPRDGEAIQEATQIRSPGFHWVETDYLPGPAANAATWEAVRGYLGSKECDPASWECVNVGGSIPEKYVFHKKR